MSDVYEWRTFEVGERVRVRVSAECRYCLDPQYEQDYARALSEDGRVGTIVSVGHNGCCFSWDDPDPVHEAHRIWVKWAERRDGDDPELDGVGFDAHFAASELEPIS